MAYRGEGKPLLYIGTFVKIFAWNIHEGFLRPGLPGKRAIYYDRLQSAKNFIAVHQPDVLILNEALYARPVYGQHIAYANMFQYPHAVSHLYKGEWGNAILSKKPITRSFAKTIPHTTFQQRRSFLAAQIEGIWISTYHPHPHRRPRDRSEDFKSFLSLLSGPSLLAGDLNAIHPDDGVFAPDLIKTFCAFQSVQQAHLSVQNLLESGRELFHHTLPALGWKDAMPVHMRSPSMPTELLKNTTKSRIRIDHVLINENITLLKAHIIRCPSIAYASDHYPIGFQLF